jgi:hypothetical protein
VKEDTRRSTPDDLRRAQSSGEWPGANTTFCRGRFRGASVELDGIKVEELVSFVRRRVTEGGGDIRDLVLSPADETSIATEGKIVGTFGVVSLSLLASASCGVDWPSGGVMEAVDGCNSEQIVRHKVQFRSESELAHVSLFHLSFACSDDLFGLPRHNKINLTVMDLQ